MIFNDRCYPDFIEALAIDGISKTLKNACALADVDPNSLNSVIELGGGVGRYTRAILRVCPQAIVQVISFKDQRDPDLKTNKRITFFEGEFVRVLKSGKVGPADMVVLQDAGDGHGFNQDNLEFLARAVGQGILITGGHNSRLISDSFYTHFSLKTTVDNIGLFGTHVWRVK